MGEADRLDTGLSERILRLEDAVAGLQARFSVLEERDGKTDRRKEDQEQPRQAPRRARSK